ncbi:MAG: hypothetical protein V1764_04545 [Nitrospirota bacterium]
MKTYTEDFIEALTIWEWPGNVRELINAIDYAISESGDVQILDVHYLKKEIRAFWTAHSIFKGFDLPEETKDAIRRESDAQFKDLTFFDPKGPTVSIKFIPGQTPTLEECKNKLEWEYMRQLKDMVKTKKLKTSEAAELAGIHESSYHRLIEKHGL